MVPGLAASKGGMSSSKVQRLAGAKAEDRGGSNKHLLKKQTRKGKT